MGKYYKISMVNEAYVNITKDYLSDLKIIMGKIKFKHSIFCVNHYFQVYLELRNEDRNLILNKLIALDAALNNKYISKGVKVQTWVMDKPSEKGKWELNKIIE